MDQRNCVKCAELYQPTRKDQRFCCRRCCNAFYRDSAKATCSEFECDRPVRAKGVCAMHRKRQVERPKDRMTATRRAGLRKRTQRRRALIRDPDAAVIDRDEIGERDGWRCGLCREPVDRSLAYPHIRSPSLDHIEPLSLGGKHIVSNVQIAHLACNMAKGNRVTDVQLLLVG